MMTSDDGDGRLIERLRSIVDRSEERSYSGRSRSAFLDETRSDLIEVIDEIDEGAYDEDIDGGACNKDPGDHEKPTTGNDSIAKIIEFNWRA